ncbi:hypothetical protein CEUSTIGMA_g13642.t1 [Chlamydomonas eustigma]|uniref:Uncharacterized protein n=1 Tax=Chlamydomonas eustigma TaxID=1157962 RepID=A0A250XTE3_9CHLO|nr:hypothetical protein CEUSTIGMA_g13642.t1 [Chlamydomonas eustigma]|eukprot:GAX86229.1 hypothetical protein CEUSTIGMA_g13642.t1 [Chlamydomonas eustigma]
MLDFGSNVFLITDVEARRIGIPILRHKIALNTANGASTILGVTPPLLLSYGSKERELLTRHCMLVIKATPSTCFDLLVGNADCAELRAVHDTGFNTLSLYPVMRDPLIFTTMSYPLWISALLPSNNHDNTNPTVGIIDGTSAFLAANHAATLEALHVLETIQTQLRVDVNYWNAYNKHLGVAALLDALTVVVKTSDLFTHDPLCDVHPVRRTFSIHLLLKSRPLNAFNAYDSSETLQYIAGIFAFYIRKGSECPLLHRACNLSNPNVELKYLSRPRASAFLPNDVPPVMHRRIDLTPTIGGYTSATIGFREALTARIRYDRNMLSDEQPFAVVGICILFPDPCALWLHGIYPRPLKDTEVSTPYDNLDPIPAISFNQVRSFIIPSLSQEVNKELRFWDSSLAYPSSFMRSATLPSPTVGHDLDQWSADHSNARHTFTLCIKCSTAIECGLIYAHDLVRVCNLQLHRMNNEEKAHQVKKIFRNDKRQAFSKRSRMEQREMEFMVKSGMAKKMYQENVPKEEQDLLLLHNPAGLVKWMNKHLKALRSLNRDEADPHVHAPSEHVALRGTDDPPQRGHRAAAGRGAGGSSKKGRRSHAPVRNNRAGEEDQPYIKERGSIADLLSPAPAGSSGLNLWEHGRPSKILWNTSDQTGYEKAINESTPLSDDVTHEEFFWNEWEEKRECVLSTLPAAQGTALIKQVKRWVARFTAAAEQSCGVSKPLTIAGSSSTPMEE